MTPKRGPATVELVQWITATEVAVRRPRRTTRRKSSPRTMRCARASTLTSRFSGRELGAPLATTSRENRTARSRAHAQTEAVHLGTTTVVGLERALAHGLISSAREGCDDGREAVCQGRTTRADRRQPVNNRSVDFRGQTMRVRGMHYPHRSASSLVTTCRLELQ